LWHNDDASFRKPRGMRNLGTDADRDSAEHDDALRAHRLPIDDQTLEVRAPRPCARSNRTCALATARFGAMPTSRVTNAFGTGGTSTVASNTPSAYSPAAPSSFTTASP
jgi:hypothetical protein